MRLFTTACLAASSLADHNFSQDNCEDKHVQIHVGKRGKITRQGSDSMILRVKNPCSEEANYTAMVIFNRENCGMDFLNAVGDGRVTVDLLDAVDANGSIFFPGKTWVSDNKAMSRAMATFHKEGNCEKCLGTQKTDSYDMIIAGYDRGVQWGNKDPKKCFETAKHAFYGVKNEPMLNTSDELACVLYQSLSSKDNNSKNWPDGPPPPPTTMMPTFFEERPEKIQEGLQCTNGPKIVGGQDAKQGSYPWQVSLYISGGDGGGLCGGSILSENWVITAAHCCEGATYADVYISDYDYYYEDEGEFIVNAEEIIMHPNYGADNQISNDICLLRVPTLSDRKPANCDGCYGAICLPPKDAPLPYGKACFVSGWGSTWNDGQGISQVLQEVSVNIMSHQYCMDHTKPGEAQDVIEGREFCGGIPDENNNGLIDGGKDSCQGDSGGPVTCVFDDQPVLTGIVSWGIGCAEEGHPGVYVDVAQYIDWIEETMATDPPVTTPAPTTQTSSFNFTGFDELPAAIPEGLQCTEPFRPPSSDVDEVEDGRIVGGNVVEKGTYPWQVRLSLGPYLCGGSIISENWIMTAAHCCDGSSADDITVHVGDWDSTNGGETGEFSVGAREVIIHQDYGTNGMAHDVCLLNVPTLSFQKPDSCDGCYASICLPERGAAIPHGKACFVSGWGTLSAGGAAPAQLQAVAVNVLSHQYCVDHTNENHPHIVPGAELCAAVPDLDNDNLVDGGKDACQGDSGGPLACIFDGQPVLTGVVSWGIGCAGQGNPGLYANVANYIDWIWDSIENSNW